MTKMGNGDRKVEIGGSVSGSSILQGDITGSNVITGGTVTGSTISAGGTISINKNYLDRMPEEYAESLKQFSDFLNEQIQQEKISPENAVPIKQSVDRLAKAT